MFIQCSNLLNKLVIFVENRCNKVGKWQKMPENAMASLGSISDVLLIGHHWSYHIMHITSREGSILSYVPNYSNYLVEIIHIKLCRVRVVTQRRYCSMVWEWRSCLSDICHKLFIVSIFGPVKIYLTPRTGFGKICLPYFSEKIVLPPLNGLIFS